MRRDIEIMEYERKIDNLTTENEALRSHLDSIERSHQRRIDHMRQQVRDVSPRGRIRKQHTLAEQLRKSTDVVNELQNSKNTHNTRHRFVSRETTPSKALLKDELKRKNMRMCSKC